MLINSSFSLLLTSTFSLNVKAKSFDKALLSQSLTAIAQFALWDTLFACKSISFSFLLQNQPTRNNRNKLILCSCPLNFLQTDPLYCLHKALWKLLNVGHPQLTSSFTCVKELAVSLGTCRGGIKSWLDLDRKVSIWTVGHIAISYEGCHAKRVFRKGSGPNQPLLIGNTQGVKIMVTGFKMVGKIAHSLLHSPPLEKTFTWHTFDTHSWHIYGVRKFSAW